MTMTATDWSVFAFFVGALTAWLACEQEAKALRVSVAQTKVCIVDLLAKLCRCEANLSASRTALAAANRRAATFAQFEERAPQ